MVVVHRSGLSDKARMTFPDERTAVRRLKTLINVAEVSETALCVYTMSFDYIQYA